MRNRHITIIGTLASALISLTTVGGTLVVEGTIAGELSKARADTGESITVPFYQQFTQLGAAAENLLRQGYQKGDALMLVGEPDYSEWTNDVGAPRSTVDVRVMQLKRLTGEFETVTDKNESVRMVGGMNEAMLIGNLTADVVLSNTKTDGSGDAVANLRLAANEVYTSKSVKHEKAHYFNVTVWREQATALAGLKKGDPISVKGPLLRDTWLSPEGEKQSKRYVEAETVIPLARRVTQAAKPATAATAAKPDAAPVAEVPTYVPGMVSEPDFEPAF